ncbi:MAG: Histidine kinase [Betaproteobacteria bacterium]|nr:Histidine kinase [Betaproteobacteria bacterium]
MKTRNGGRAHWPWEMALLGSIMICVGMLVVSELGHMRLQTGYNLALREMRAAARLQELLGYITDAEAGQRGFLLTRRETYLESYKAVLPKVARLEGELHEYFEAEDDPLAQQDFRALEVLIGQKASEMALTIGLVREGRSDTAREITGSDIGKEKMDLIRMKIAGLQQAGRERTTRLIGTWEFNRNLSRFSVAMVSVLNIVLLVLLFRWLRRDRDAEAREQQGLREEQGRLDRLVQQRTAQLDMLATHIQRVSENEKTMIARELHDELGSILTASKMDVAWVRQHLGAEQGPLADKLMRALKNLDQAVQAKRRIVENLRPTTLTTLGLVVALREHVEQATEQNGWQLQLDLPDERWKLPEDASIALFRIAQESLNNAAKYAAAKNIRVRLEEEAGRVCLLVEDDGRGFRPEDARPRSHGLAGMRQRMMGLSGSLEVVSQPGQGTQVRATLPLAAVPAVTAGVAPAGENALSFAAAAQARAR